MSQCKSACSRAPEMRGSRRGREEKGTFSISSLECMPRTRACEIENVPFSSAGTCYGISLFTELEKLLSTPALLYALTAKYQRAGARSSMTTLVSVLPGNCTDCV